MYPTDVTPAEAQAGFQRVQIHDPDHIGPGPAVRSAVVCQIDASHRLVKMDVEPSGIWYNLEKFGILRPVPPLIPAGKEPEWVPIQSYRGSPDPVLLVRDAIRGLEEAPGTSNHYDVRVPPE